MRYVEIAWITEDGKSAYVGDGIKELAGWTAEEVVAKPLDELFSSSTLDFFRQHYSRGAPDTIIPLAFTSYLLHRDGHKVCCRSAMVCRYDADGQIAEAWGSIRSQADQCTQNRFLECWECLDHEDVAMLSRMIEACA